MGRAQRNPSFRPRIIDDELSAQLRSGRQLLFHSQSRRSRFTAPDRSYRSSANRFSIRTRPACIHDRCHRHIAGSSSCDLVIAGRRCRFCDKMEARQSYVFACLADARADFGKPIAKGRTWHMATALLGAHPARWARFLTTRQLHSFQSRETRIGNTGRRLALFIISSNGSARCVRKRLGWRRVRERREFRGKVMGFAALHPSYALRAVEVSVMRAINSSRPVSALSPSL
jgi:hypothetical protein